MEYPSGIKKEDIIGTPVIRDDGTVVGKIVSAKKRCKSERTPGMDAWELECQILIEEKSSFAETLISMVKGDTKPKKDLGTKQENKSPKKVNEKKPEKTLNTEWN